MRQKKPLAVCFVERVIRQRCAEACREELRANASKRLGRVFLPSSIRAYWHHRIAVYFCDKRNAWIIADAFDEGLDVLIFAVESQQWRWQRHSGWQSLITHEEAEAMALHIYNPTTSAKGFAQGAHYTT